MSDVMLIGVLRMPPDLWRDDALDISQRHSRYIEAADRIESDAAKIESLQRENEELRTDRDNWKGWEQKASQAADRLEQEIAKLRAARLTEPTITPEMREKLSEALAWIEKQIDSGSDVTISRLHEHSTFGPAVVVSVRRGYSSPAKIYGETLVGAISTAANSDLLGEKEYLSGDSIEKQKYLPSDLLGEQG